MDDMQRILARLDELEALVRSLQNPADTSLQEKCLTVHQAADRLSVTPGTVYGLIRTLKLKASRVGTCIRISPDDLRDYLDGTRVKPRPALAPRPTAPRVRGTKGGFIFFPPKT
jgi:excisionase family DNA binding protein